MAKNILMVGAESGQVGKFLQQTLINSNYETTLLRSCRTTLMGEKGKLPKDVKAVINIVGEPILSRLRRWDDCVYHSIQKSRVEVSRCIMEAIAAEINPPEVFLTISALTYYPTQPKEIYVEDSIPSEPDIWSKVTTELEASGKCFSAVRQAILRCGVVLQRPGANLTNASPLIWSGRGGGYGTGMQWFPWIHADDLEGIFLHVIHNSKVEGILNAVVPEQNTNLDVVRKLRSISDKPYFIPVRDFVLNEASGWPRSVLLMKGQNVYPERTLKSGYEFKQPALLCALKRILGPSKP